MSLAYAINDLFLIKGDFKNPEADLTAGKDLTGFNLKAQAKENLTMHAGNNLTLSTKADEKKVEEHKVEKNFGFQGHKENNPIRKNVGVSLGYTQITTDTTTLAKTHNNQTLSANNITLSSNNIKTQTELHVSINGNVSAKAESMGSALLTNPIKINGNLGANISTSSAEQSGIKSQSTQIKVGNQTKLTGAYISATEKSSIETKTIKANSLIHLDIGTNQEVGIKGNANILGGLMAGGLALVDLIFKTDSLTQPGVIGNLLFAEGTLGGGKWLNGVTTITPKTHSSSVSKPISIKTNKPLGGILVPRGELQEEKKHKSYDITNEELFGMLEYVFKKDKK